MRLSEMLILLSVGAGLHGSLALAKGLNELAEDAPEAAAESDEADDAKDASGANKGDSAKTPGKEVKATEDGKAVEAPPMEQSAASKALADKLYLGSSFGWASAKRSKGKWKGSGMSDITLGYKLPVNVMPKLSIWGTYRYAPVAIAGEQDGISYRGVWEGHNFGALGSMALADKLNVLGSFELAYVLVYLRPLDNIEAEKKAETNGVMVNIGGGADWALMEKLSAGPRLHVGVGGFTVVQFSGEATYKF